MLITQGEVSRGQHRPADPPSVHDGAAHRIRLSHQIAIVAAAIAAYFLVRGATEASYPEALHNAHRVVDLEAMLGLYHERALQSAVTSLPGVTTVLNWIYIWGHWPVIALTLLWLGYRHPATFLRTRNAMLVSGAIGLVVFILFPVAPPRLAGLGFVDTVTVGSEAYRILQPPMFTNQYAAMPSLHVGWDLLIGLAVFTVARRPLVRALGIAMPVAMFASVVLTANHYVVDAIVGASLTAVCWVACGRWTSRRRGQHRIRIRIGARVRAAVAPPRPVPAIPLPRRPLEPPLDDAVPEPALTR